MNNTDHKFPTRSEVTERLAQSIIDFGDPAYVISTINAHHTLSDPQHFWPLVSESFGFFCFSADQDKGYFVYKKGTEDSKFELSWSDNHTTVDKTKIRTLAALFGAKPSVWKDEYRLNMITWFAILSSNNSASFSSTKGDVETTEHIAYEAAKLVMEKASRYTDEKVTFFDILIAKGDIRSLYIGQWFSQIGKTIAANTTGFCLSFIFFWCARLVIGNEISAALCWGIASALIAVINPFHWNEYKFGDDSRTYALLTCFVCSIISSAWVPPIASLVSEAISQAVGMNVRENMYYLLAELSLISAAYAITEAILGPQIYKVIHTVIESIIDFLAKLAKKIEYSI